MGLNGEVLFLLHADAYLEHQRDKDDEQSDDDEQQAGIGRHLKGRTVDNSIDNRAGNNGRAANGEQDEQQAGIGRHLKRRTVDNSIDKRAGNNGRAANGKQDALVGGSKDRSVPYVACQKVGQDGDEEHRVCLYALHQGKPNEGVACVFAQLIADWENVRYAKACCAKDREHLF